MPHNGGKMSLERKAEWQKILEEQRAKTFTEEDKEKFFQLIHEFLTEESGFEPFEQADLVPGMEFDYPFLDQSTLKEKRDDEKDDKN